MIQEVELENPVPDGAMVGINSTHPLVIKGAIYDTQGVLQPGCMICAATIPEKQAKFRSKVCSDECRKELRRVRQTPALLAAALALAANRVVVKRPRKAPAIAGNKPAYALEGQSSRFDIYAKKALQKSVGLRRPA